MIRHAFIFVLLLTLGLGTTQAQKHIKTQVQVATAQFNNGEYSESFQTVSKILAEQPGNLDALSIRGALYALYERYQQAGEDLDYAIEHNTKNPIAYLYRGYLYQLIDRPKEAENDYSKAITLDKQDEAGYRMRGGVRLDLDKNELALSDFDMALKLAPDLAKTYSSRASYFLKVKDYAQAEDNFNKSLSKIGADSSLTIRRLAECKLERGDTASGKQYLDQAIQLRTNNLTAWRKLAEIAAVKGNMEEALQIMHDALLADSNNVLAYHNIGLYLSLLGKFDDAINALDSALLLSPYEHSEIYTKRASAKYALAEYQGALEDYNAALKLNSDLVIALLGRGITYRRLRLFEKSKDDLQRVTRLAPQLDVAIYELALVQMDNKEYQSANKNFIKYAQLQPLDSRPLFDLGYVARIESKWEDALLHFNKALTLHPKDSASIYYHRISCHLELGREDLALLDIDSALSFNSQEEWFLTSMGYEFNNLGRYAEALEILNRLITLNPTIAYAYNNRGFAKYKLGDFEGAIVDFDKSIDLKNDYFYWPPYNRANAKRALGRYKEAIEDFDLSLSYKPNHPEALNDRGETWEKMGERDKAIADYERALFFNADYKPAMDNLARLK
jgi:tetratricopeptide (TPR) repeat protein